MLLKKQGHDLKKISNIFFVIIWLISGEVFHTFSQKYAGKTTEIDSFCDPKVRNMVPSKGLVLSYERIYKYNVSSFSENTAIGDGNANIDYNRLFLLKIKVPYANKPWLKGALGFKFSKEKFYFLDKENLQYPLYKSLDSKPLRVIGGAVYLTKPFKGDNYFIMKLSANLSGDYENVQSGRAKYLKGSLIPLYGWKKNKDLSYGFGMAYSYTFGNPSIYPIIAFYRNFSPVFGVEAVLPQSLRFRYNINNKSILSALIKAHGNSYNIQLDDTVFSSMKRLELRKAELRFGIDYEREIYDFLWFGVNSGYRMNLVSDLAKINKETDAISGIFAKRNYLIETNIGGAFFINVALYIVPPKRFLKLED